MKRPRLVSYLEYESSERIKDTIWQGEKQTTTKQTGKKEETNNNNLYKWKEKRGKNIKKMQVLIKGKVNFDSDVRFCLLLLSGSASSFLSAAGLIVLLE